VKSNIGHTQAAAGVAGVIKTVLALQHGVLPQTLHVSEPTPEVDWSTGAVRLLTEQQPWPEVNRPRRAGVSSFGMSGTNAHVILEQAAAADERATADSSTDARPAVVPWVLSGRSTGGLRAQAERLRTYLAEQPGLDPVAVGRSLATTRAVLNHRAVILGQDREELLHGLRAIAAGEPAAGVITGSTAASGSGGVAWMFAGQGTQRLGMGRELYDTFPTFAQTWDEVCAHLDNGVDQIVHPGPDGGDPTALEATEFAQSALFALEVSLARLLQSWGLTPDYLLGHSIGELAAAHIAGVLSLEDACTLVAARGRLMGTLPDGGAMASVEATETDVTEALTAIPGAEIAAINGPTNIVISGTSHAIDAAIRLFEDRSHKTRRLRVSHAFHSALIQPMLAEYAQVAAGLTYHEPQIPIISTLTATLTQPGQLTNPDYWVQQARHTVRFHDGLTTLAQQGSSHLIELGPDGTLSALARTTLPPETPAIPLLRKDRPEPETTLTALAHLHTTGAETPWTTLLGNGPTTDLPTYAFQRHRYWPQTAQGKQSRDVRSLGLASPGHPLLGAALQLAEGGGFVFTGRLSLREHSWLADHTLAGTVLFPGTGFLELAARVGEEIGCGRVEELALAAPLVLPQDGALVVQVVVGTADAEGRRAVSVSSRRQNTADPWDVLDEEDWTRHADGTLAMAEPETVPAWDDAGAWPPEGADAVGLDGCYDTDGGGFGYGPAFQGLRAAWRYGDEVFAEVVQPEGLAETAGGYLVHPAVLDAALQAVRLGSFLDATATGWLPFSWSGAWLGATDATTLRVRMSPAGPNTVSLRISDRFGEPVAAVESLALRPVPAGQPAVAAPRHGLLQIAWPTLPAADLRSVGSVGTAGWAILMGADDLGLTAGLQTVGVFADAYTDLDSLRRALDQGASVPEVVFVAPAATRPEWGGDFDAVRKAVQAALAAVRTWTADPRFADSRMVVVTQGAVGDDGVESAGAAVCGLLRSAQSEFPGLFQLLDLDGTEASYRALPDAVGSTEPQIVLRSGQIHVPRLARAAPESADAAGSSPLPAFGPHGTVLVTGGTGGLGSLVARHLVHEHGVRSLLLLSRRGTEADGAADLVSELTSLGARVTVAACDVADRTALAEALTRVAEDEPLRAVVHTAGILDDGVIGALDPERIDRVLRPKVAGAIALHELTEGLDLSAFVLFSSVAGLLGGAGQGNYAAANAALDALARRWRAAGRPAVSLAWGMWAREHGMTARLGQADEERVTRSGIRPLSADEGLALFDAAMGIKEPLVAPVKLDPAALRGVTDLHALPPMLRGLVSRTARRPSDAGRRSGTDLRQRWEKAAAAERHGLLLEYVCTQAAAVLGYRQADQVEPEQSFLELGFDSLTGIELRNGLSLATGLQLPATLVFDHPSAAALAEHLAGLLAATSTTRAVESVTVQSDVLSTTHRELYEAGRSDEGNELLLQTARLRAQFQSVSELGELPEPVQLARGGPGPMLVCVPANMPLGGVNQYVRFARPFRGIRDVSVVSLPGFQSGERLPATLDAVLDVLVGAIRQHVVGAPFVLVGASSGGALAQAVAGRLEESGGDTARAVVLMDTFSSQDVRPELEAELITGMWQRADTYGTVDGTRLTASRWYVHLLGGNSPEPVSAPTLLLRASRPTPGRTDDHWRTSWDLAGTIRDVRGDHFSMLEEFADTTAAAVSEWLTDVVDPAAERQSAVAE
jgi:acyl transferase domain-containing protein/acyl carrier protein